MSGNVKINIFNDYDQHLWDKRCASLGGNFFHTHSSCVYRARIADGVPLFVEACDEGGNCQGIAAGFLKTPRFWPFSRYCRIATFSSIPVANGELSRLRVFLDCLENEFSKRGVHLIEFESYDSNRSGELLTAGEYTLGRRHEYEFDLKKELNELFAAFSATKRKNCRYAEKHCVVTCESPDYEALELVESFRNITMKRRALSLAANESRISEARRQLHASGRTRVLVSYMGGEPVGACLFGVFGSRVFGLRGGASELGNRYFSMVHLYWTAIQLFKEEGFESLSLGGAKESEEGLRSYKQMLGAIETFQPSGKKILSGFGARLDGLRRALR